MDFYHRKRAEFLRTSSPKILKLRSRMASDWDCGLDWPQIEIAASNGIKLRLLNDLRLSLRMASMTSNGIKLKSWPWTASNDLEWLRNSMNGLFNEEVAASRDLWVSLCPSMATNGIKLRSQPRMTSYWDRYLEWLQWPLIASNWGHGLEWPQIEVVA